MTDSIRYIGVDDISIDLFENQYVVPEGMAYNSYLILDDAVAVMDTVDARCSEEWLRKLDEALDGREADYLVVSHVEPDHSGTISLLMDRYPDMKVVGNDKTFGMLGAFYGEIPQERRVVVKEGDTLDLGSHKLNFIMAPMIHWPEVMMTYESTEQILFSADAFGKFGALVNETDDWACEARRYYFNIVGKYGSMVQNLLKKTSALQISAIAPLHGPVLTENIPYYLDLYNTWSSYKPEDSGVLIACASIHGNTMKVAETMADMLRDRGVEKVILTDVCRADIAEVIEDAFRYDRIILAASSYDGGVFAPMSDLLHHLASKGFRDRKIGIIENGSWGPTAARTIKGILEPLKNLTVVEPHVTIRSSMKATDMPALEALADVMSKEG